VALESTRTIEIDEFVDRSEIDPRYLIRPYYLRPDGKVGHNAFAVIRETIREMYKLPLRTSARWPSTIPMQPLKPAQRPIQPFGCIAPASMHCRPFQRNQPESDARRAPKANRLK
jgi:Ku70/Ku80 beta-barrel domain